MTKQEIIKALILKGPGRTASQLANAIYGERGYQQLVNSDCELLAGRGELERRGVGGVYNPFRYYLSR